MFVIAMKKSFKLSKPKNIGQWALLLGGALVGGYILKTVVFNNIAKAHFANSSNSIYPVHNSDLGDSMNAIVPTARQKYSTVIHPHHLHSHHGPHHRSFPDYTDRANGLPSPFLEHNHTYDFFNRGANLANIIDKAAYVQTYDGNQHGAP
jgi:hypothetical protein